MPNRGYDGASVPVGNPLEPAVATAELQGRWPEDCVLAVPPHTLTDPVPWGGRSACRQCAEAAENLHRSMAEIAEAEREAWRASRDIFIR